jgi:hypothetical protein
MTALIAAAAAFLIAALAGKPLIQKLNKSGLSHTMVAYKGEERTPGRTEAADFGSLLLLAGLIPAGILSAVVLSLLGGTGSGFSAGKITSVLLGTLLMAVVGLTDDWRAAKRLQPMNTQLRWALIWCVGLAFLFALVLSGSYSTLVLVPFAGSWIDIRTGIWYLLLILGAACGGNRQSAVSGQSASVSLIQCLTCAGVCGVFGSDAATAIAFAAAGSLLGLLLYAFPPEKLREGSGGRMMMAVLPVLLGIQNGTVLFLLPAQIPFLFEGIYVMIRIVSRLRGKPLQEETLSGWLLSRGWSGKAVSGVMPFLAFIGGAVSVLAAYLYL